MINLTRNAQTVEVDPLEMPCRLPIPYDAGPSSEAVWNSFCGLTNPTKWIRKRCGVRTDLFDVCAKGRSRRLWAAGRRLRYAYVWSASNDTVFQLNITS